jgi:sortase B
LPEYADLYLMNSDIVGWIRIEDTNVNYPVMQTPYSPDYYLKRDFNKESNNNGCIYVREQCDVFAPSDNLTIYGHNMRSGAMFANLFKFKDKSFWETHKTFTFDTLLEHHTYEIIAVFKTTASVGRGFAYHHFVNAKDEADFDQFIATCKKLAFYDTGVSAVYGDKLITLSTCEYSQTNGRLVVVAKRVTEG